MYLISDLIYSVLAITGTYVVGPLDFGWIMGYTLWGAAALHPTMAPTGAGAADRRISNRRLAALAVVSLVPLLIAVRGAAASRRRRADAGHHRLGRDVPARGSTAVGRRAEQRSLIDERTRMQGALERLSVEDALTGSATVEASVPTG